MRCDVCRSVTERTPSEQSAMRDPTAKEATLMKAIRNKLSERHPKASEFCSEADLLACLLQHKHKDKAIEASIASYEWLNEKTVTIDQISEFFRAPVGCKSPPGCLVLLEDGTGDVARDLEGRPIVVIIGGMLHGTVDEMMLQIRYVKQRLRQYTQEPLAWSETCGVVETQARTSSDKVAFRLPSASDRQIFDVERRYVPGSQYSAVHFCGLPRFISASFSLCKAFLSKEICDRMFLMNSYSHLSKHIDESQRLPHWCNGTLEFDLDEYVEWRAREEGVDVSNKLCPRGHGRAYQTSANAMPSAKALIDSEHSPVIRHGVVQKQGSGYGFFSSTKWKTKLLVVMSNSLAYFDSTIISEDSHAARQIPLDENSVVETLQGASGPSHSFRVQAAGRNFDFGVDSEAEVTKWKASIEQAISNIREQAK